MQDSTSAGSKRRTAAEYTLLSTVWALDHALRSLSKRMQFTHGITGPQRLALLLLSDHGMLTPGELAEAMHLHPSTLTGILDRLQQRALLARVADTADGRRAHLTLTKRGLLAVSSKAGTVEAAASRARARVTATELETALRVLRVLIEEVRR